MGRAIVRTPAGLLHGRAAVQPRRQDAGADPHRHRAPAAGPRRHDRLRHARPGRGDDDGRPGRGDEARRAAAGRHPAQALRQARQPLRRRLHRVAADEPHGGHGGRRRRQGRQVHRAGRPHRRAQDVGPGHRRRPSGELAHRHRRGGWPARQGHGRRGARRRQLRLRHLRRGGHALQRDRPRRRTPAPAEGRDAPRHHRPRRTSTSSTPSRASASPTESSDRTAQHGTEPREPCSRGLSRRPASLRHTGRVEVRHRFRAAAGRPGARPARHRVAGLRRRRRARGHPVPGRGRPGGARGPAGRAARARRAEAARARLVPAVLDGGLRRLRGPLRRDAARGGGARGVPAWSWGSATST